MRDRDPEGDGGARIASIAGDKPIAFRIGVNLGDIVIDGDDIFGDGVNVAARLESQAPAGGVLLSDSVHAQVKGKVDLVFADAGEIALKNIEQPVRVWRWGEGACCCVKRRSRLRRARKSRQSRCFPSPT